MVQSGKPASGDRFEVDGRSIELSRPDKLLYPQDSYSKRDVAGYYHSVATVMVPHLRGRPLTLRRFPDGLEGEGFFQKEAPGYLPDWIRVAEVPQRGSGGPVHHVVAEDAATLLYLANQACLEFHMLLSTVDSLERPDLLVLDIDPPEGTRSTELRSVVRDLCRRFERNGLVPHIQATGGKGFHVVAPLAGEEDFEQVRRWAGTMAMEAAESDPERLTTEQRKDKRGTRMFLDINRNAYGQTMIAPYSLRARPGAPAATPLESGELARAAPGGHGLANMARRLRRKRDPWADMHGAVMAR
ncbi:bifunctional non-homologous end joining protein LigD [Halopolyspora algeriensis]|uniref:Bifunctional non-homologous end joining protein LigD n=1 Tax=Halopolyspora algeriensis TaxID=1500506 RepID=A0A368VN69_9ACTN|nr:non-homologous end-joining DNA ligase [Halopolyspora algeriensis]RCW43169.1 bifunctional non-homologous end joining protein LigD [Halopolyspora algeriensis]TQM56227.1 bifunctional non-homologous end joining protein LigD [Halopolyspora algeriensis]